LKMRDLATGKSDLTGVACGFVGGRGARTVDTTAARSWNRHCGAGGINLKGAAKALCPWPPGEKGSPR
jgi:hypothetical protein